MMWISSPWELKADGLANPGGVHHVVHVHPDAVRRRAVPAVRREQDWRCVALVLRKVYYIGKNVINHLVIKISEN